MKNRSRAFLRGLPIFFMAVIATVLPPPGVVQAQTPFPYADFEAMTLDQLSTLQVKLTFLGAQKKIGAPSLVFTSSSKTFDLNAFAQFQNPTFDYHNDTTLLRTFSASQSDLMAVIDNVGTLPNVTAGAVATDAFLSFMLVNSQPSDKGFEAILNSSDSADLFDQLRSSLAANKDGLRTVSEVACPLDLLQAERPTDESASVSISFSGIRLRRRDGLFVATATVTNNSAQTLAEPVSLVVDLAGSVRLTNADGTTCGTSPEGRDFIDLPGSLGAGESAEVVLEFDNPDRETIAPPTKVLAGPGAR